MPERSLPISSIKKSQDISTVLLRVLFVYVARGFELDHSEPYQSSNHGIEDVKKQIGECDAHDKLLKINVTPNGPSVAPFGQSLWGLAWPLFRGEK